jgi:hypothetical protein
MHARRSHAIERHDGARQLALHGAGTLHALHERGHVHRRLLVEQLVAGARLARQSAGGEFHAHVRHLVARYQKHRAVTLRLVGNLQLVELLADAAGLGEIEPGIEQAHRSLRMGRDPEDAEQDGTGHSGHRSDFRKPQTGGRLPEFRQLFHCNITCFLQLAREFFAQRLYIM